MSKAAPSSIGNGKLFRPEVHLAKVALMSVPADSRLTRSAFGNWAFGPDLAGLSVTARFAVN